MKKFEYKVKDELGIHARPAGLMVKQANQFQSGVTLSKAGKSADAKRIFAVMSLAVKKDDVITMTFSGEDEDVACSALLKFCRDTI